MLGGWRLEVGRRRGYLRMLWCAGRVLAAFGGGMRMDLKDLKIFARVAALQNLSAVAQELGVSAGTISKRIQALEDELAVRLIGRTTRSSRLTEEGRMFLVRVERVLAEMDLACDEIRANTGRPAGHISISAPTSLLRQIINPALVSFVQAFPDIDVRVDISDDVANLHEQGYDAAIRTGTLADCTLKAKRLASDRVILVASPDYVAKHGAPQRPADLETHTCLLQGDARTWMLHRGEEALSVRVSGRLASDNGVFLLSAALDGAGVLRTSELAVLDELQSGALLPVLPEYELAPDAGIWAVYPNAKHTMPRLRVFLDHLADFCRDHVVLPARRGAIPLPVAAGTLAGFAEEAGEVAREPARKRSAF